MSRSEGIETRKQRAERLRAARGEKRRRNWEERGVRRPPAYKVLAGILAATVFFYLIWTGAYLLSTWIHTRSDKEAVFGSLATSREQLAEVWQLHGGPDAANAGREADEWLERLSRSMGIRAALLDRQGGGRWYGGDGDWVSAERLEAAFAGETVRDVERIYPLGPGTAVIGGTIASGVETAALFVREDVPGWFNGYVRNLMPMLILNVLMFVAAIAGYFHGMPQRIRIWTSILGALRRIAAGDFNVRVDYFDTDKRRGGDNHEFVDLIDSINDMADGLKEMEQMRQEFISNVSHEIQSPLTSIGGFAKALHSDELSREQRDHYLAIIETETQRLSKLSDNLLKLSSLESDRTPFERKQYRLDKQLRAIVLACEPQWQAKRLDMDIDLEDTLLYADEDLMSQVWTNLVHNSIKFTPEQGRISVRVRRESDGAVVTVADSGIGMTEEEASHAFERFYKADKSRNRAAGGSGLGLSIVRKIVDMHGGHIRMESRSGEGTTIVITMPDKRFQQGAADNSLPNKHTKR